MSMRQKILGHFESAEGARGAFAELRRGQLWRRNLTIHVRTPGKNHEELPLSLTDARGAILRGIFLGALVGFVGTAAMIAIGSRWLGFEPMFAWIGGIGGMVLGAFAGSLMGSGQPHPAVLAAESEGGVVLVVESVDDEDRTWAESVMRRHQGRVEPMLAAQARASLAS
jgi:hypothetical protein